MKFPDIPTFRGFQAPGRFEADIRDIPVIQGAVPEDLNGGYYRAGPDPFYPPLSGKLGTPGMAMDLRQWTAGDFAFMFGMWAVMMVGMMTPSAALSATRICVPAGNSRTPLRSSSSPLLVVILPNAPGCPPSYPCAANLVRSKRGESVTRCSGTRGGPS